jgi:hypothetical protein
MNRLIAAVMLTTLAAIAVQIARAEHPRWAHATVNRTRCHALFM